MFGVFQWGNSSNCHRVFIVIFIGFVVIVIIVIYLFDWYQTVVFIGNMLWLKFLISLVITH